MLFIAICNLEAVMLGAMHAVAYLFTWLIVSAVNSNVLLMLMCELMFLVGMPAG